MWSLGTVTSAVLTGRSIFVKSQASYQARSFDKAIIEAAALCDLQELDRSVEWERVSAQGRDFVKKLLVLDEKERMTTVQALEHEWFTSKECENSSDALYQQAIKNWKPRYRAPLDLFADLELYANAQKTYIKVREGSSSVLLDILTKSSRVPFHPKRKESGSRLSHTISLHINNCTSWCLKDGNTRRYQVSRRLIQNLQTSRNCEYQKTHKAQ